MLFYKVYAVIIMQHQYVFIIHGLLSRLQIKKEPNAKAKVEENKM